MAKKNLPMSTQFINYLSKGHGITAAGACTKFGIANVPAVQSMVSYLRTQKGYEFYTKKTPKGTAYYLA